MRLYIDKPDQEIQTIVSNTFPSYNGRKIQVSDEVPSTLDSYWSGGSKNTYVLYHLDQRKAFQLPTNHPYFEADKPNRLDALPDRVVIVKHTIFCGKDLGITIIANKENMAPMLPKKQDLSEDEIIVLRYTERYKNTYGGQTNIRYMEARRDTQITPERWESAKQAMIDKKLLRKNGSITPAGRNAVPSKY